MSQGSGPFGFPFRDKAGYRSGSVFLLLGETRFAQPQGFRLSQLCRRLQFFHGAVFGKERALNIVKGTFCPLAGFAVGFCHWLSRFGPVAQMKRPGKVPGLRLVTRVLCYQAKP